jgi:hypothetical protein
VPRRGPGWIRGDVGLTPWLHGPCDFVLLSLTSCYGVLSLFLLFFRVTCPLMLFKCARERPLLDFFFFQASLWTTFALAPARVPSRSQGVRIPLGLLSCLLVRVRRPGVRLPIGLFLRRALPLVLPFRRSLSSFSPLPPPWRTPPRAPPGSSCLRDPRLPRSRLRLLRLLVSSSLRRGSRPPLLVDLLPRSSASRRLT